MSKGVKCLITILLIAFGVTTLVVYGKESLKVMKDPYNIEEADLSQVKIGDYVTLDVTISLGAGAEIYVAKRNVATGERTLIGINDMSYLIPIISNEGNKINVDHVLSVKVMPENFEVFNTATSAFCEWIDLTMEDVYEFYDGVDFNQYINEKKNLDMDKLPQNVVYHYEGIVQEIPYDVMDSEFEAVKSYGLRDRMENFYIVPAPDKEVVFPGAIIGIVLILVGIIVGIVFMKKR